MSVFKCSGIVLKKGFYQEKIHIITVFTNEYGKIQASYKNNKKEKTLDIGYAINFEIDVNPNSRMYPIKNIKILHQLHSEDQSYEILYEYLLALSFLYRYAPMGEEIFGLYDALSHIHKKETLKTESLLYLQLKLLFLFGMCPDTHSDEITGKILRFIQSSNFSQIAKLSGLQDPQKEYLRLLIKKLTN